MQLSSAKEEGLSVTELFAEADKHQCDYLVAVGLSDDSDELTRGPPRAAGFLGSARGSHTSASQPAVDLHSAATQHSQHSSHFFGQMVAAIVGNMPNEVGVALLVNGHSSWRSTGWIARQGVVWSPTRSLGRISWRTEPTEH